MCLEAAGKEGAEKPLGSEVFNGEQSGSPDRLGCRLGGRAVS